MFSLLFVYMRTNTTAPSATPKWLTVGCSHPTSVQLSWGDVPKDHHNGIITGYSIQIEGSDSTRNIQATTTVAGRMPPVHIRHSLSMEDAYTSEEVSDLRPSTEYSFRVSAKTVAGSGPAISVSFVTPQEGEALILMYISYCLNINGMVCW